MADKNSVFPPEMLDFVRDLAGMIGDGEAVIIPWVQFVYDGDNSGVLLGVAPAPLRAEPGQQEDNVKELVRRGLGFNVVAAGDHIHTTLSIGEIDNPVAVEELVTPDKNPTNEVIIEAFDRLFAAALAATEDQGQ